MKHTNIAAILKWAEVPENSEGLFLQPEELATVDNVLGELQGIAVGALTQATALETANAAIATLETAATENGTTISTQAGRIIELEAEVARLGKNASGTGTTLKIAGEEGPSRFGKSARPHLPRTLDRDGASVELQVGDAEEIHVRR